MESRVLPSSSRHSSRCKVSTALSAPELSPRTQMAPFMTHFTPTNRHGLLPFAVVLGLCVSGCGWLRRLKTPVGEEAFPAWSESMGSSVRGKAVEKKEAKPSGLLFDKRSEEIEKNLGGNF